VLYDVTDLGSLGGPELDSYAHGINITGQVVGSTNIGPPSYRSHAFLYSGGVMSDLGTLAGKSDSNAWDINDVGQVVGDSGAHAFFYSGGSMTDLGTLGGTLLGETQSYAYGINSTGQAVGWSYWHDPQSQPGDRDPSRAFLYSGGVMMNLGTLGGSNSLAFDINDAGQVVGRADIVGGGSSDAFLYSGGVMTDLGTLGGLGSDAQGINNLGQVVGQATRSDGEEHAFLYSGGVMTDLGTLGTSQSTAFDINTGGQVVGWSNVASGGTAIFHAFVYNGGSLMDLNSLIPSTSGWTLTKANAINDVGQIVGDGTIGGAPHGFLLTPRP